MSQILVIAVHPDDETLDVGDATGITQDDGISTIKQRNKEIV